MMKTVYTDGVYDITNEQYHASEGISRSKLMLLDKSPYHFWYETMSGLADKQEKSNIIEYMFVKTDVLS